MVNVILIYNDLNEKLINAINTLNGSMSVDNLIKNHKVDYLSPALISPEAVDNDHGHLAATRYKITSLVQ